jgi:hypothetical protein
MAIQSLSYLDIPQSKRRSMVAKSVAKIREGLTDPAITPTQKTKLQERMAQLEMWVAGTLPVSTPSPIQEGS